ncbi:MAG: TIGR00299 family protein [Acidobacteria bacterium RBG_16_68_9]|nr:MAG: TIGR00299 family protein [Acidobacteria bacterium RBG_16_68_9]
MRVLYFDAFSGVSGDMTVGALLALGVDFERLRTDLRTLPVRGYELRMSSRDVNGIHACKFDVEVEAHEEGRGDKHQHRTFRDLRAMLEASPLRPGVKQRALAIFTRLAEAEGRVHGVASDDVTFHEVGAIDSIVDIVGASIGLEELGVERAYVSALPLGSGIHDTQHGPLPAPGPATVELLRGFPVRIGDGTGELVTPTGAAIVSTLASPGEPLPVMRVERVGYGAGTRTVPDRPNVLRLLLGTAGAAVASDEMVVLETNIDDSTPEIYEYVMEELFAAGARDVWLTPAQMKKNRPGVVLHALAEPTQRDAVASVILRETTAIGVRCLPVQRLTLPRQQMTVDTEFGTAVVKIARAPDGTVNVAPEYESCKRLARERGVALKTVYQAAVAAARRRM